MVYRLCDYRPVKGAWKLLRIDWISSYCVYAANSLEVDLTSECRLAFFFRVAPVSERYSRDVVTRPRSETS
jgi:hypothetical protein